ncbi:MAG: hypothetical protein ACO1NX_00165 [Chitinophagaceae bacterium]
MQIKKQPAASFDDTPHIHHSKGFLPISVSTRKIIRLLSIATLLLLLAHLASYAVQASVGASTAEALDGLFNLSRENNFPSYFSAFLLLAAALLFYGVHLSVKASKGKWQQHWWLLSGVMVFLSIDEAVQLHERLPALTGSLLQNAGSSFLHFAWVIPYTVLFLAVAAYFLKFVLALPPRTRNLFLLSGFLYVGGALGFEFLEGNEVGKNGYSFAYWLMITVEEIMEMAGVIVLIYALLQLLQQSKSGFVVKP